MMDVEVKVIRTDSPVSGACSEKDEKIKIVPKENINREIMDIVEDSGFSSTSTESGSDILGNLTKVESVEGTIGDGIKFVDPQLILSEQREKAEKLERLKRKKIAQEQKIAAREAFEKEIQEQQYKRLIHLLHQSKALTSFITKKIDMKGEKKKPAGRKRNVKLEEESTVKKAKMVLKKTPTKRSRRNRNLSDEEIKRELNNLSDEEIYESPNKENENVNSIDDFVQPKYFKGELRNYQKEGVNWLRLMYENGLNGILADEMGLGKTIQVIALFAYLFEKNIAGPYMIIVPLSTLPNWTSEFERFAPQLPVVVYYGNEQTRHSIRNKIHRKIFPGPFKTDPIILTTYQVPINDASFLRKFNWRYIVIDEAQRIKNFETQLFRIVKSFTSANRLLLTGTPLQNNLTELWSLLNFLLPDIFNNLEVFQDWFDPKRIQNDEGRQKFFQQEQEKRVMATLREILHPFMLRRLKEDVCPDVPPIKEVIIYTPLTNIQYDLYSSIIKRDISKLQKVKEEPIIVDINGVRPKRKCTKKMNLDDVFVMNQKAYSNSIKNLNSDITTIGTTNIKNEDLSMWNQFTNVTEKNVNYLIRLRMCNEVMMYRHVVNHPYLIHYPMNDCGLGLIDENLVTASGKILVLDAMLKKLKSNGHKVLLFSTMTMVLNIIEDYLSLRDYKYERLDGAIDLDTRRDSINRFQTDREIFLFLLTTKAGAVGLNLAAADTVIIYDSDWNPQNDLQAMARCHRIGQTKPVAVYRLCTKGTIDEDIIKRANAKRFLEKAVISNEGKIVDHADGLMRLKKMLDTETFKVVDPKNNVYSAAELDELLDRSDMVFSSRNIESL
ncbi:lymphocyte-specific helicase-like [Phymastichus coffea]|uniref:lymphocyte-specific helicase-like n=1 Tax=Phymastichus coffea TaxID=108790 RepID=UPI00273C38EF|nr:lymphocyte-specific helicase-like [Phymastichus coffea]